MERNANVPPPKKTLKPVATARIINPAGQSSQDIEVGDMVRHDRFGVGKVEFLDGTDSQNIKAKVIFANEGEKNLILKFAKLTKIWETRKKAKDSSLLNQKVTKEIKLF